MSRCFIIAEAGVNHNGSIETAKEMISLASNAGVDAIKFQTFKAQKIATRGAGKAQYQKERTDHSETHFEMLQRLELSDQGFLELKEMCEKVGIEFMSTAFDTESFEFLAQKAGVKRFKIPSGEITNAPLLLNHALSKKDIILSTGMASLGDIEAALSVLAYGFINGDKNNVTFDACYEEYCSPKGQEVLRGKVTLMHCTSEYPTPYENVNLRALQTLNTSFRLPVGISDHSLGLEVPVAAIALGATVIEKHFTLDKMMPGPDHRSSLDTIELRGLVEAVRNTELALGDGVKYPRGDELLNRDTVRKNIVASKPILTGEVFTSDNIDIKRGKKGLSPIFYWNLLGKKSSNDLAVDDPVVE